MKRRGVLRAFVLVVFLLMLGTHVSAAPQPGRVHFTAAGDFSSSSAATSVLNAIDSADSDLTLALGDLSYGTRARNRPGATSSPARWAPAIRSSWSRATTRATGRTATSTTSPPACPTSCPAWSAPTGGSTTSTCPPTTRSSGSSLISPGARRSRQHLELRAPALRATTGRRRPSTARARPAIPWVVVGMHKPCISVGKYTCDAGRRHHQPAAQQEGRPGAERTRAPLHAHQAARPGHGLLHLGAGHLRLRLRRRLRRHLRRRVGGACSGWWAPAGSTSAT